MHITNMKKIIIINLFVLLFNSVLICSDFYKNLEKEGKEFYMLGKYSEAVENFRIAEFGLHDETDILKEIYLYSSLAYFKLKDGDKVIEITDKLKKLTGILSFRELKKPDEIRDDLDSMFSVIERSYAKKVNAGKSGKHIPVVKDNKIERLYKRLRGLLKRNDLNSAIEGIKNLRKLGKNDLRVKYISGVIHFRKNHYKKAMSDLLPVTISDSEELVSESSYYLALLNYFKKDYGRFLYYCKKVKKKDANGKLAEIKKKVERIRYNGVLKIKNSFFSKKDFKSFINGFDGDILLASDILDEVLTLLPVRIRDIYFMSDFIVRYPNVYNKSFILKVADLLIGKGMSEYAINIIKKSKFFKDKSLSDVEVFYKLGLIYLKVGDKKRAKKIMLKVYNINKNYKKVNHYLTN